MAPTSVPNTICVLSPSLAGWPCAAGAAPCRCRPGPCRALHASRSHWPRSRWACCRPPLCHGAAAWPRQGSLPAWMQCCRWRCCCLTAQGLQSCQSAAPGAPEHPRWLKACWCPLQASTEAQEICNGAVTCIRWQSAAGPVACIADSSKLPVL